LSRHFINGGFFYAYDFAKSPNQNTHLILKTTMKKLLTITLLIAGLSASAQKLPAKATIVLTDRQILRMDSAINAASTWTDSKQATSWYSASFTALYEQIRKQMIVDTAKVKQAAPGTKKP